MNVHPERIALDLCGVGARLQIVAMAKSGLAPKRDVSTVGHDCEHMFLCDGMCVGLRWSPRGRRSRTIRVGVNVRNASGIHSCSVRVARGIRCSGSTRRGVTKLPRARLGVYDVDCDGWIVFPKSGSAEYRKCQEYRKEPRVTSQFAQNTRL